MASLVYEDEQGNLLTTDTAVDVGNLPLDVFANLVTGQRDNQIEVHFDDTNFASYLNTTTSGGVQGGSAVQQHGHVHYSSGTSATGRIQATTLDTIKYRPMHEVYAGWTASFTVGVANSWQRVGFFNATDGIFVGYEGDTFGITWRNNSGSTFIPRSSWSDPCTGLTGSKFTRGGVPETLDPTKGNLYRLRLGWLGVAGFIVEVLSPDMTWVPVYQLKRINSNAEPYLANPDLPMGIDVGKTSGATDLLVTTNCWAAGTTSAKARLTDPITDRSLAETVRATLVGKTTAGGGGYVDVKVNPSGTLAVGVEIATATVTATDLDIRDLSLQQDSVRQTLRVLTPLSTSVAGPVTDQVLVPIGTGQRIRLLRNAGHCDPALDAATYPLVTIKIGATTIYRDKLEAGLPWSETVCFEGADGEDLTISVDAAATIYLNMRFEVF